jgi:hypothetical protein
MCTVLLPPGGNPIAVKYIILHHIYIYIYIYINMNKQLLNFPSLFSVCIGKVAPGHVYLPSRQVSPVSIIPPLLQAHLLFLPSTYVTLPINHIFKPHLFVTSGRWKKGLFSCSKHYVRYVRFAYCLHTDYLPWRELLWIAIIWKFIHLEWQEEWISCYLYSVINYTKKIYIINVIHYTVVWMQCLAIKRSSLYKAESKCPTILELISAREQKGTKVHN